MGTTTVPVKSAWTSKVNWGQAVSFVAMILATFGVDMDDKTRADILAIITAGQSVYTWIVRTWFTSAITPSSVKQ